MSHRLPNPKALLHEYIAKCGGASCGTLWKTFEAGAVLFTAGGENDDETLHTAGSENKAPAVFATHVAATRDRSMKLAKPDFPGPFPFLPPPFDPLPPLLVQSRWNLDPQPGHSDRFNQSEAFHPGGMSLEEFRLLSANHESSANQVPPLLFFPPLRLCLPPFLAPFLRVRL